MKKLLLIATLALALAATAVACTSGDTEDIDSAKETTAEVTDTESETEPTSESELDSESEPDSESESESETTPSTPVSDFPAWDADKAVVAHQSFDQLVINDTTDLFTPGASDDWDKVANLDETASTLKYWGWVGTTAADIGAFGYRINGGEIVWDAAFAVEADQGVVDAATAGGAVGASRMAIYVNVGGIWGSDNTVEILYKTADESATVLLNMFVVNKPVVLYDVDAGLQKMNLDSEGGDNYSTYISGWMGFTGKPIATLGYAVDDGGIIWVAESDLNRQPEQGVFNEAGEYAIRFAIKASFDGLPFGKHEVIYYAKLEDATLVEIYSQIVETEEPAPIGNATFNFNTADNADLETVFTFLAGANPELCVYNAGPYTMSGINQLTTTADGTYVWSFSNLKTGGPHAAVLLRGNPQPDFGDANYYGHDKNNNFDQPDTVSFGCAGIYVGIIDENGTPTLRINVKGEVDGAAVPHVFKVAMSGYDLKIVDNNDTVTFYEGDTLLATVDLNGNSSGYATSAIVTLADGTTQTLDDVCAAATAASDIGLLSRHMDLTFDAMTLTGLPE